eukprot:457898-Rhodomonas_salina.2
MQCPVLTKLSCAMLSTDKGVLPEGNAGGGALSSTDMSYAATRCGDMVPRQVGVTIAIRVCYALSSIKYAFAMRCLSDPQCLAKGGEFGQGLRTCVDTGGMYQYCHQLSRYHCAILAKAIAIPIFSTDIGDQDGALQWRAEQECDLGATVSCYAPPTRCPITGMIHVMRGTDVAYGAIRAVKGARARVYLTLVRVRPTSLRTCYAVSSTDAEYDAASFYVRYATSGTDIAYDAMYLRTCYAMSGTEIEHGTIFLRAYYAMSGTDIAYGAMLQRTGYAMSGPDLEHAAMLLRACYAMSGTELAYQACGASVRLSLPVSLLQPTLCIRSAAKSNAIECELRTVCTRRDAAKSNTKKSMTTMLFVPRARL